MGVDGSACGQLALDFAFTHAATRGAPVTALRAWQPPGPPWTDVGLDIDAVSAEELAAVATLVRQRQDSFPAVPTDVRVVADHPAHALVAASDTAQLVVVGSRGRGSMAALLLGSVTRHLVQHAACPVAVVHGRT